MFTDAETGTRFSDLISDLGVFDDGELTDRFRELELVQRRAAAEMAAIAGEVDRRGAFRDDGHRSLSAWLRAHGNYAPGTVTRTKRLAGLLGDCPAVGDELYAGRIGVDQAAELGRARANPRCGDKLHESVGVLLDHGQRFDYADFVGCVKRWETLADLDGAHADRGDAIRARRAAVIAGVDGVDISASGGTGLQAAEMAAILDAFAEAEFERDLAERRQRSGGDGEAADLARTNAQRRFDALLAIFRTANTSPATAHRRRQRSTSCPTSTPSNQRWPDTASPTNPAIFRRRIRPGHGVRPPPGRRCGPTTSCSPHSVAGYDGS